MKAEIIRSSAEAIIVLECESYSEIIALKTLLKAPNGTHVRVLSSGGSIRKGTFNCVLGRNK